MVMALLAVASAVVGLLGVLVTIWVYPWMLLFYAALFGLVWAWRHAKRKREQRRAPRHAHPGFEPRAEPSPGRHASPLPPRNRRRP
jgi:hypothetical protein